MKQHLYNIIETVVRLLLIETVEKQKSRPGGKPLL